MGAKIRIGALISGGGSNLQAIIAACRKGAIDGRVVFVGSDRPGVEGLKRAVRYAIPHFVVDYTALMRRYRRDPEPIRLPADCDLDALLEKQTIFDHNSEPHRVRDFFTARIVAEQMLLDEIAAYPFDLLVLAGFMRNLTPYFIDRINSDPLRPRIMNIHPALLPAFPGTDGYGDTWRYGCRVGGCTVHFIDYGEDSGPIIGQRAFPIHPDDTLEAVRQRGLALEWELYPECIQLFAQGRLETVDTVCHLKEGRQVRRKVVRLKRPAA